LDDIVFGGVLLLFGVVRFVLGIASVSSTRFIVASPWAAPIARMSDLI
jgi:hypothetical protein